MLIQTTTTILNRVGTPLKVGSVRDPNTGELAVDPNSADVTLRDVVTRALEQWGDDDKPEPDDTVNRERIIRLFWSGPTIDDFAQSDADYVKSRVRGAYVTNPLVLGQVLELLAHAAQIPASNGVGST